MRQGWLHSSAKLVTGGRQILRFHYAGDLIGTSSIAWAQAANTITAVSDCVVSELSKVNLGRIFKAQPRLAGLLYAMAAAENVAMSDRLASIGRTDAIERLATLLLDILARLRVTAGGVIESFDLPLTQKDIGDAVGLTPLVVLVAVTGCGLLFGGFAVILAIPLAAVIATLIDVIVRDKDPAEEDVPAVIFSAKDAEAG